ncbi:MAG: alpha/beta hydrolase [Caldilineaceae bacterium]|nr:alpha/beta hydrolase [Caldilineaceae bacterium]
MENRSTYLLVRLLLLAGILLMPARTYAETPLPVTPAAVCDPEGTQSNGAKYIICIPKANWNGTLFIYAHGYVAPDEPLSNNLTLPDGTSIVEALQVFGYGIAATSYSHNGLAVLDGVESVTDLVTVVRSQGYNPQRLYLLGVSQGGLVATLAAERWPHLFDGGLAFCGPYGDLLVQSDYFTDARVLFDYFFPDLLPGTPVEIPQDLFENWSSVYTTTVKPALVDPINSAKVNQLLQIARIPSADNSAESKASAIQEVLWYNVKATNDAIERLGGQPYDNQDKVYSGSDDDEALNAGVARFRADQSALDEITARYRSTGNLRIPLVTMHTTGDPVVPYDQTDIYKAKVDAQGQGDYYDNIRVEAFGHCTFSQFNVLQSFGRLQQMVDTLPPYMAELFLPLVTMKTGD